MGVLSPHGRIFTKKYNKGRLSIVSEKKVQVHFPGTVRYSLQFTEGELCSADGVGFILSADLPCARNIQKIISVALAASASVCMKELDVGDRLEVNANLVNQTVTFTVGPHDNTAPSSASVSFKKALENARGYRSMSSPVHDGQVDTWPSIPFAIDLFASHGTWFWSSGPRTGAPCNLQVFRSFHMKKKAPWCASLSGSIVAMATEQLAERGSALLQQHRLFSEQRSCRDVFWAAAFSIVALCVLFGALWSSLLVYSLRAEDQVLVRTESTFSHGLQALLLAGVASTVFSMLFLQFTKRKAECVVWTSLLLGPCCAIIVGLVGMVQTWPFPGLISLVCFCVGVCYMSLTICCFRDLVPATVVLLKAVVHVLECHPSMMILCVVSSLIQLAWQISCAACLIGAAIQSEEIGHMLGQKTRESPQKAGHVILPPFKAFLHAPGGVPLRLGLGLPVGLPGDCERGLHGMRRGLRPLVFRQRFGDAGGEQLPGGLEHLLWLHLLRLLRRGAGASGAVCGQELEERSAAGSELCALCLAVRLRVHDRLCG